MTEVATSSKPFWQKESGECYVCGGSEAWESTYGVLVCTRCHPPAAENLVKKRGTKDDRAEQGDKDRI